VVEKMDLMGFLTVAPKKIIPLTVTEEDKVVAEAYLKAHACRMATSYKHSSFEYFSGPKIYEIFEEIMGDRYKGNVLCRTILLLSVTHGENRDGNSSELLKLCNQVLGLTEN
jgi:hypothetical protein